MARIAGVYAMAVRNEAKDVVLKKSRAWHICGLEAMLRLLRLDLTIEYAFGYLFVPMMRQVEPSQRKTSKQELIDKGTSSLQIPITKNASGENPDTELHKRSASKEHKLALT